MGSNESTRTFTLGDLSLKSHFRIATIMLYVKFWHANSKHLETVMDSLGFFPAMGVQSRSACCARAPCDYALQVTQH